MPAYGLYYYRLAAFTITGLRPLLLPACGLYYIKAKHGQAQLDRVWCFVCLSLEIVVKAAMMGGCVNFGIRLFAAIVLSF